MILQLVKLQEKKLFFPALYLRPILREARSLPLPLVLFSILLESAVTHVAFVSCFSTHFMIFSWRLGGGGHATHFSIFYLEYDIEKGGMGRLPSCVFVFIRYWWKKWDSVKLKSSSNVPIQSFLLLSCFLSPHFYCQEISLPLFLFNLYFLLASCFLFLHFQAFPKSSFDIKSWSR